MAIRTGTVIAAGTVIVTRTVVPTRPAGRSGPILIPIGTGTIGGVIIPASRGTCRGVIIPASMGTSRGVIIPASMGTARQAVIPAGVGIPGQVVIVSSTLRAPGIVGTIRPPPTACGHPDGSAGRRPLLSQGAPPGVDLTVRNGRKQTCEQRSLVVRTPCGRTERDYAME